MHPLKQSFVTYEGICTPTPTYLDHFIDLHVNFTLCITYKTWPIYTLHKVSVLTHSSYIQDGHLLVVPLTLLYQYSVKDLYHTLHTTTQSYTVYYNLPTPQSLGAVYVDDLFAYCLDSSHIYTALSLLVVFA